MQSKLQPTALFISILSLVVFGCSPLLPAFLTPANPDVGPASQTAESQIAQPTSDVISSDNAKNIVEIATWGKGIGHHPAYSPDGGLLAVSSSSGIYLYDSQTLQESMYFPAPEAFDMEFSPDGQTLSAVSGFSPDEYEVRQWDLASGAEIHSSSVDSNNYNYSDRIGALSPDGRTLALIFDDQTVKLWDMAGGQELSGLSVYFPADLAFSTDGRTLASTEADKVILWNISNGSQLRTIVTGPDLINPNIITLAFSPDGRTLATGSEPGLPGGTKRGTVQLWDVASGRKLDGFSEDIQDIVSCLAFSPDGRTLAAGSSDAIVLWDAAGGNELLSINARNLESLTFSPDGRTLVSASSVGDDSVKLWDVGTGSLLTALKGEDVSDLMIFSPDGRTLAYPSSDDTVRLRDAASGEVRILSGHPGFVTDIVFSPDGKLLASGSFDTPFAPGMNVLKLWDVAGGRELRTLGGLTGQVWGLAFSPDGRTLAAGTSQNTVKLWDVAGGSELRTLGVVSEHSELVYSVAFSPDGRTLASGSSDNTVKLWDVAGGSQLRTLSGHTNQIISVTFSPDGRTLISQSYEGNKLWDVAGGQELAALSTTWSYTAISPDGKALATGFEDGTVKVLDPASGDELYTLSGHTKAVSGLAFSPDGKILATGGDNIKLWDAAGGQELASLSTGEVYGRLAFSPDGRLLLSWSSLGLVRLWAVQP